MNNDVEMYITNLPTHRQERIEPVVSYIRETYPDVIEECMFSPKSEFPVFRKGDSYVAIASNKQYVTVHFSSRKAVQLFEEIEGKIKLGVGCVKIPDNFEFPFIKLQSAIDETFSG